MRYEIEITKTTIQKATIEVQANSKMRAEKTVQDAIDRGTLDESADWTIEDETTEITSDAEEAEE